MWKLQKISETELELERDGKKKILPFSYNMAFRIAKKAKEAEEKLEIEPSLNEWLQKERRQRKFALDNIDIDSPLGSALETRKFQQDGVKFAVDNKNVIIADEPGLGKTLQAIAAIIENDIKGAILIVAPKTAAYVTWLSEMSRWTDDEVVIIGGKQERWEREIQLADAYEFSKNNGDKRLWVITTPNYLRMKIKLDQYQNFIYTAKGKKIILPVREGLRGFLVVEWSAVIVDEAHQTLAGASGNIKKQSAQRRGLGLLRVKEDGMRIALTGTPFRGRPDNIWGVLNWLKPKDYTSYWTWVQKHFYIYNDGWGDYIGNCRNETRLFEELKELMIRRTKAEVVAELPAKVYGGIPLIIPGRKDGPIAVWLDMEGSQASAYAAMAKNAMVELDEGTLSANGILAEMTRLKQFANSYGFLTPDDVFHPKPPSNKIDWIIEFLAERGIDGNGPGNNKIIIASQFTKFVDLIETQLNKLNINTFSLTGKTSENDRVRIANTFQSDDIETQVFLLNTKAGGVSLTLDAADEVVVCDQTWNPDDQTQVEDRAHRISRMHNVTIWSLASRHSIDESLLRRNFLSEMTTKKIMDGERGIDYAKQMLMESL